MTSPETPAAMTLRLIGDAVSPKGHDLCLEAGDILVAVNGQAFLGDERALYTLFAGRGGHPLALSFWRVDQMITVLATSPRLGTWESCAPVATAGLTRLNPTVLTNWEIMRDQTGSYDLHPLTGSILALVAAPVWLIQMRLWLPGAALIAAIMVTAVVSPLMCVAAYLGAGVHMWHSGPRYFQKDRMARGLRTHMVLAAPSERAAHAAYRKHAPNAQFLFAPPAATATQGAA